jgi:cupin fold WbuC family metalloprotein
MLKSEQDTPPNVIRAEDEITVVGQEMLRALKTLAWCAPSKRSRLILHRQETDKCQEMVICLHKLSYVRPHRHPHHKSESYLVLEGEMSVALYNELGPLERLIELNKENFLYRMTGGWYHQPIPRSEWVIYKEVYTGPFRKDFDVVYAPWSRAE